MLKREKNRLLEISFPSVLLSNLIAPIIYLPDLISINSFDHKFNLIIMSVPCQISAKSINSYNL